MKLNHPLNEANRGHLIALLGMPGFEVLQQILEEEVEQFKVDMINANPSNTQDILAKHALAKAAAVYYTKVIDRLNHEKLMFGARQDENKIMADITEPLFS